MHRLVLRILRGVPGRHFVVVNRVEEFYKKLKSTTEEMLNYGDVDDSSSSMASDHE